MANNRAPINLYGSSAAYDLYRYQDYNYGGSAAPEIQNPGLPEERIVPERVRRVKAKTAVAPFAVVGLMVAACMLILVVFGYVQLYEATEHVSSLKNELYSLQEDQAVLESLYEGSIDLNVIEARAAELGLVTPSREQTVYINLSGSDRAEIYETEHLNLFQRIIQAIESSATGLVEYLS